MIKVTPENCMISILLLVWLYSAARLITAGVKKSLKEKNKKGIQNEER